ncbi:MAG: hypothetical protein MUE95_05370 [Cyclobacteriaceae bacterium]|jgi:hypothetical protein|nr:hypothetical protein [Cyclobacteriaceae bacterium]
MVSVTTWKFSLKKLRPSLSILLLALILMNAIGFYFLLVGLRYDASRSLVKKLDHGAVNEAEKISVAVPLTIPYYNGTEEANRINGEFEYEGDVYRLVSQRVSKDTLYIEYIKDRTASRIESLLADFVSSFTDQSTDHQLIKLPSLLKDYMMSSLAIIAVNSGWTAELNFSESNINFASLTQTVFSPPPKG